MTGQHGLGLNKSTSSGLLNTTVSALFVNGEFPHPMQPFLTPLTTVESLTPPLHCSPMLPFLYLSHLPTEYLS